VVFASHSHDDHFNPDIVRATATADAMRLVVADDVADLYGDVLPPDTVAMGPGEVREVEGMRIEALESNDQGVAYRIGMEGLSIYFGGDLALWDWPGQSPAAARAVGMSWRRALRRIKTRPVDVAFSNMDPRLHQSLSGAPEFIRTVAPRIFVPMHLNGHVEYLERFADRLAGPKTTIFRYTAPGDALDVQR
jgi:L-ascorbate metabolism protein UlaG (beta-lactamase superfamily)